MKNFSYLVYTLLSILFLSCEHTTDPIKIEKPIETDYSNFRLDFVDFDSVHIVSNEDFLLDRMSVKEIIVYGNNELITKAKPSYTFQDSAYTMFFNIPIKDYNSSVNYIIYFNSIDNTFVQVEVGTSFLWFPDPDARFEFMIKDIPDWTLQIPDYKESDSLHYDGLREWGIDAFDIDELNDEWVFLVRGHYFKWNKNSNTVEYLNIYNKYPSNKISRLQSVQSPGGNNVAFYNNALYFDYYSEIRKYDFNDDSYTFFFSKDKFEGMTGNNANLYASYLTADDSYVYILVDHCYIFILNHSGEYVDHFRLDQYCTNYSYHELEVYDNILYLYHEYYSSPAKIRRYDLINKEFLPPINSPNSDYKRSGLRIVSDRVYYIWSNHDPDTNTWGPDVMVSISIEAFLNE